MSWIARNGYIAEQFVCEVLNNDEYLQKLFGIDVCNKVGGYGKVDIKSQNDCLLAQVKKFKRNQFQQLHKCSVDNFVKIDNRLSNISYILKGLCEYPLIDGKIDKTHKRILLCDDIYKNNELDMFMNMLTQCKYSILESVFLGNKIST